MAETHTQVSLPDEDISIPQDSPLRSYQWWAGGIGLIGLILSALFGFGNPRQFFFSYLTAYLFCLTLAIGALAFVIIQFLTRAGWSVTVRRIPENVMATLPLLTVLFLPLLFGLKELYPWTSGISEPEAIIGGKNYYLNTPFFLIRAFLFLGSWSWLAYWFRKQSLRQDIEGGSAITRRLQTASGAAIVWFAISLNFASFDWIMSLDPHWYSTIFGVYIFGGSFMSILAFTSLILVLLQRKNLLRDVINEEHYHDLGKLLFAFVVFWAYIAFSQYMLIWYANLPEETIWYAHRMDHGWYWATVLLAVGHFVLPFFFLLPRTTKRNPVTLAAASIWLLAMHYVDLYWMVMPSMGPELHLHLLDLLALIGVGGIFASAVIGLTVRPCLIPRKDPRLAESLSLENR